MRVSISFLFAAAIAVVTASNVVDLTPDNFDDVVGTGKPALVEFFAPWCGHCKNLAPIYEELADAFAHAKDKVVIAKVDADAHKALGSKYGVKGFPTLKWFDAKGNPESYESGRELLDLVGFVTKQSGVKSKIKPPPPPATTILTSRDFDDIALDESKDVLVTFTAPWCGHCKTLKPIYEKVATTFKPETNCLVANIDADNAANAAIKQRYGVSGYPTIKFFPKGSKEPVDYTGARTEEAFVEFLNKQCGTHRAVGGGLNEIAGKHSKFDELASEFFVATGAARDAIYADASSLAAEVGDVAKHYIRVMDKVKAGGEAYLEKELKRLASILEKRTMSPSKLDEIKIKANILSSFVAKKIEEVVGDETSHEEL
jgi:protein disulfide-isomerase A6